MRGFTLAATTAICLLGCASPQERAQQQQAEMQQMMAEYGPACTQLGYAMNSDPWRECILQSEMRNGGRRGGVSTSIFGGWGSGGRGSGIGIGIGIGR
ncbi:hypothetical protein [Telluria aromaticivorans]|uniref:Uncharacterized protein n=1 Tax=Telluria aromaticivorans TaxID=2725995 RepID=A0A7Y2JWJ8_9BURK|nr:hypothetical protein [Telluria aromaticivorans]NNG22337.1 hypothetical protein [Telluria aromaticivorans]